MLATVRLTPPPDEAHCSSDDRIAQKTREREGEKGGERKRRRGSAAARQQLHASYLEISVPTRRLREQDDKARSYIVQLSSQDNAP
ncbi:unnamed protein product [Lota lota]